MNKISCNVIRDLLPSYMDGVASDDSVKLIEEHLAGCAECMNFKSRMEKPELHISDNDICLDYMKKIRRSMDLKSAVCFFLVLTACALYLGYTKNLHQPKPFFILVAVMLFCNYLLFFHNHKPDILKTKKTVISNAVSIFLALYIMCLMKLSIYNWLNDKDAPFHIGYSDLGPFLYRQLMLVMVLEIMIWIRELVLHIRKARFSIISSSFGIIGFYMSLYYARMLKSIETLDSFHVIQDNALLLFLEGIGILLLLFIFEKAKDKIKLF